MASLPDRLVAGRLELRRNRTSDCAALRTALRQSFDELHRWMSWADRPARRRDVKRLLAVDAAHFDRDESWPYVLVESASGELVGSAGLRRGETSELAIGYWVRSDRTGRGYARAAARALTTAAFAAPLGIERVEISMDRANRASATVPERLGYQLRPGSVTANDESAARSPTEHWVIDRAAWALLESER